MYSFVYIAELLLLILYPWVNL